MMNKKKNVIIFRILVCFCGLALLFLNFTTTGFVFNRYMDPSFSCQPSVRSATLTALSNSSQQYVSLNTYFKNTNVLASPVFRTYGRDPKKIVEVTEVENHCGTKDDFWKKIEGYAAFSGADSTVDFRPWNHLPFRDYFFGKNFINAQGQEAIRKTYTLGNSISTIARLDAVGKQIDDSLPGIIIAADLPFSPFIQASKPSLDIIKRSQILNHDMYLPRSQFSHSIGGQILDQWIVNQNTEAKSRTLDLAEWNIFIQYYKNNVGEVKNKLLDYIESESSHSEAWPVITKDFKDSKMKNQVGSYNSLLIDWTDSYGPGYHWNSHEGDHHVNSAEALALVKVFELSGDSKYLKSAELFVRNQFPRYGYHSGLYKGVRYYWTGYNPSSNSLFIGNAAVNNVQALVASVASAVGYHTGKKEYLEFARGLLWYMAREYELHGRLHYYGTEVFSQSAVDCNPYETVALDYAFISLPYLYAKGAASNELVDKYSEIYQKYLSNKNNWCSVPTKNSLLKNGEYLRAWKQTESKSTETTVAITYQGVQEGIVYKRFRYIDDTIKDLCNKNICPQITFSKIDFPYVLTGKKMVTPVSACNENQSYCCEKSGICFINPESRNRGTYRIEYKYLSGSSTTQASRFEFQLNEATPYTLQPIDIGSAEFEKRIMNLELRWTPTRSNISNGVAATLEPAPNYVHSHEKLSKTNLLTDGSDKVIDGNNSFWMDKGTIGWTNIDPTITLNFGTTKTIRGVSLNTAAGKSGVIWPQSIEIFTSKDCSADTFARQGELVELSGGIPSTKEYKVHRFWTNKLSVEAQCLKLKIKRNGLFVFINQIEVY